MKRFFRRHATLWMLIGFCLLLGLFLSLRTDIFFTGRNLINILEANSFKLLLAIGMTFVIASGGIDLSVGAVVALCCMTLAVLMRDTSLSPFVCMGIVLVIGLVVGALNGFLITFFRLQPFIVTLGTMFLCRGLTAILSRDSVPIDNELYGELAFWSLPIGDCFLSLGAIVALAVVVIATFVLKFTSFGRGVYAAGGNEQSARLMGLKVDNIRIKVYMISGFCSALGGIAYSMIMLSGYTQHALGMEMDAIASSVIGGTQLMGGVAFIPGCLVGVMIQGTILTIISFQGTLSAWWTKIVVGILLCGFIMMQALVNEHKNKLMRLSAEGSGKKKQ